MDKIAFAVLELDRKENAAKIRGRLSFLPEVEVGVCDGRHCPECCAARHPEFEHLFRSVTNPGLAGLWSSVLSALKALLGSGHDAVLVLEDDAVLVPGFEEIFMDCVARLPEDWGMFSVGYRGVYVPHFNEGHVIGEGPVCRMFQSGDSWGVLYRRGFAERMLRVVEEHKIMGGFPDTAIMAYAVGNNGIDPMWAPYSIRPSLGSLIIHDCDPRASSMPA